MAELIGSRMPRKILSDAALCCCGTPKKCSSALAADCESVKVFHPKAQRIGPSRTSNRREDLQLRRKDTLQHELRRVEQARVQACAVIQEDMAHGLKLWWQAPLRVPLLPGTLVPGAMVSVTRYDGTCRFTDHEDESHRSGRLAKEDVRSSELRVVLHLSNTAACWWTTVSA